MLCNADVIVEIKLLQKDTDKPFTPDGVTITPAKAQLQTTVMTNLPCGSHSLPAIELTESDVSDFTDSCVAMLSLVPD